MQGEIFTTNRNTFSALAVGPLARWSPLDVAPCAAGSGFPAPRGAVHQRALAAPAAAACSVGPAAQPLSRGAEPSGSGTGKLPSRCAEQAVEKPCWQHRIECLRFEKPLEEQEQEL